MTTGIKEDKRTAILWKHGGINSLSYLIGRALCQVSPYLIGFVKARHHLLMDTIDTAATNGVMRVVLHERFPSIAQLLVRIGACDLKGHRGKRLCDIFKLTRHSGISLLEVNSSRGSVG